MNLNSEINITLDLHEARRLWIHLNDPEHALHDSLRPIMKQLEHSLWNQLSIDELDDRKPDEGTNR